MATHGSEKETQKEMQASSVRRGRGTAKVDIGTGHPWDAFYNAPQAESVDHLSLEDAKDAIVKAAGYDAGGEGSGLANSGNAHLERFGLVSGDSWRNIPGPDGKIHDERVSHLMCRVLRYHIETLGLAVDEEGYVNVSDLLAGMPELHNTTEEDVRRVVKDSVGPKGSRFELREGQAETGLQVRATYKHPKDGRRLFGERRFRHRGNWGIMAPWVSGRWNGPQGAYGGNPPYYQRPGFSRPPGHADFDDRDQNLLDSASRQLALEQARQGGDRNKVKGKERINGSSLPTDGLHECPAESAAAATTRQERWERYLEPETHCAWFWNEATDEVFYADDPASGWERYEDSEGRPWWWNEARGCFFFEEV